MWRAQHRRRPKDGFPSTSEARQETWLVTGATGFLGSMLVTAAGGSGRRMVASSSRSIEGVLELDLRERPYAITQTLERLQPDRIFHLAAIARPSEVAAQPEISRIINVEATLAISDWSARRGKWLMFASTDQVFGGTPGPHGEHDTPAPMTLYGEMKAEAEIAVLEAGGLVARFGWILGDDSTVSIQQDFIQRALTRLRDGEDVAAVFDEHRTPISVSQAASLSVQLGQAGRTGLMHVAGQRHITPYSLLRSCARSRALDVSRIKPISGATLAPPGRPRDLRLETLSLARFMGDATTPLRGWA